MPMWVFVMLAVLAVLSLAALVGAFVVAIAAVRTLDDVSARADAQIARLLALSKAESMAEFAAVEKQMHRERMEEARAEAIDSGPQRVATLAPRRSNLGIWARRTPPAAPIGEKG